MRPSLFSKLFLSLILATAAVVVAMVLFFNGSFRAGFVDYLNDSELERLEQLAVAVGQYHARSDSWLFLQQQPSAWPLMLMQLGESPGIGFTARVLPGLASQEATLEHSAGREQKHLHRVHLPLASRISLLDLQQQPLVNGGLGMQALAGMPFRQVAVVAQGKQVGWLRVYQDQSLNQATSGKLAHRFFERQLSNFSVVALFAAALSLLMAFALVRHFLRPVRALSQGAAHLHRGEYQHRIKVFSQDELGRLALDFNALAKALQQQKTMRQQWIADISHELRTPLTALRCEIEAIQDGINPPSAEYIDELHTGVCTLSHLVDDLHQLSLTDAGMLDEPEQALDLLPVLDEVISAAQLRLQHKGISITTRLAADPPLMIRSEPELLQRLLLNLLENSFRYTDEGGGVEVLVGSQDGQITVVIQDSAPGVSERDLPRLFERLYRVDKSRSREFGGSGLGLSICKNLVAVHGGSISAEHSPLGGLRVNISFPAVEGRQ